MMPITEEVHAFLTANAAAQIQRDDEYLDPADGLLHCKTCHGLRQTVIPAPGGTGFLRPRCLCPCQSAAEKQRKAAEEKRERLERIQRRKAHGLQDRRLYDCTFANDNGKTPGLTDKAKRYVEHWEDAARKNIGLLLFGDVGTGKFFLAGCIANALLEQDVPVLMTNFPTILNRMTGLFGSERADFLASLNAYDLLILDDLGAERGTEYALEQVFAVIDARYRSRKPLVVTTNLTLDALKHPDDLAHAHITRKIPSASVACTRYHGRNAVSISTRYTSGMDNLSFIAIRISKSSMEKQAVNIGNPPQTVCRMLTLLAAFCKYIF